MPLNYNGCFNFFLQKGNFGGGVSRQIFLPALYLLCIPWHCQARESVISQVLLLSQIVFFLPVCFPEARAVCTGPCTHLLLDWRKHMERGSWALLVPWKCWSYRNTFALGWELSPRAQAGHRFSLIFHAQLASEMVPQAPLCTGVLPSTLKPCLF